MALVHKHLIVRAEVNNPLKDPKAAMDWLKELIDAIDMKLLTCIEHNPNAGYCDIEGNRGLTAVALIETSHIVLHVWDEDQPSLMQLDVYTCGPLDINKVFHLIDRFEPTLVEYKYLDRERGLVEI